MDVLEFRVSKKKKYSKSGSEWVCVGRLEYEGVVYRIIILDFFI